VALARIVHVSRIRAQRRESSARACVVLLLLLLVLLQLRAKAHNAQTVSAP
jgi:hypothetical protein